MWMCFNCYVVYLSFNAVVDLRNTVWKFERCKSTYTPWWTIAFRQLNDNEDLKNADYLKEWPIYEGGSKEQLRAKKGRHLGCILLQIEKDFATIKIDTQQNNRLTQGTYVITIRNKFPNAEPLSAIDFPKKIGEPSGVTREDLIVKSSILGPYEIESRIEPLNRCWNVLKYFRYCRQEGPWLLWPLKWSNGMTRSKVDWKALLEDICYVIFRKWMDTMGGIEKYFARATKRNLILARDFGKHLQGMQSILKVTD